ncbi:hypothetical protein SISSUDRAFT_988324 [Sistotremastrum suecicum HHB10207 ss-3]|uniref:WD40 repeat-like protein n=1 Tax=Sistotremastrum suecicum HHB10207 ss-3 TaxID=1314776 RepID=A0A166C232_9AGAM|nr:hypothetical protein SISSUDRAFT_988324 [Sistotremastrum suecicum HHB10207 ss-3]
MDITHNHGSRIFVVRACLNDDALDLVAIGGIQAVQVISCTAEECKVVANFHIGAEVTAIAWSPRATSPESSSNSFIELVAAGRDKNIRVLTKLHNDEEKIFNFGGQLTGHQRTINDLTFCGGSDDMGWKYVASVGGTPNILPDDKMLAVWDLYPPSESDRSIRVPSSFTSFQESRLQPTAWTEFFAHPLNTVAFHPQSPSEVIVSDCQGSVFLVDWRTDYDVPGYDRGRNAVVAEFLDPKALGDARIGLSKSWSGSASWKRDDLNVIGASFGDRWCLWDQRQMRGGKPLFTGSGFPGGSYRFRWCPTETNLFATIPLESDEGAVLRIYNTAFLQASPTTLTILPRPHRVSDFDWLGSTIRGTPRVVVAIGQSVCVAAIGENLMYDDEGQ